MLQLHRSERAGPLAEALASILAQPPADPFTPDLVAVPTRGMERWLTQRLSARLGAREGHGDGVCANVAFPPPGAVVGDALALAGGVSRERDPWPAERLVWPLIEVAEQHLDEEWLRPLAAHLVHGRARRFARMQRIASLFEQYGIRRPAMVRGWARGDARTEGDDQGWQPQLWMALREHVGVPSPAERLPEACALLRDSPTLLELPERLSVFGLTRLPTSYLEVLSAIAVTRDVHLMLMHPSPALWDAVARDPQAQASNRLLASWGREVRDLQTVLGDAGVGGEAGGGGVSAAREGYGEVAPATSQEPVTLLRALQADIRADRRPPGPPLRDGAADARIVLADDDASIRVHSCHGRARQVEVLREAILHRLAEDTTLEPRDVIVMCPDIETFAPLIEATFGAIEDVDESGESRAPGDVRVPRETRGGRPDRRVDLRVRLADRSLRQTNPVLGVIARVLELPEGRLTASDVLDLADHGPVRARFGFDDDGLAQIREWVATAGIHWGLDAEHRAAYKLAKVDSGTWSLGLRRLLLGVTMSEAGDRLYQRILPVDDVQSGRIELLGRLAELVDRLGWAIRTLTGPQTVAGWTQALSSVADMLTAVSERDGWQRRELDRLLSEVSEQSMHGGTGPPGGVANPLELTLPEVRALLGDRLAGRPTRANFRTGHLTICTLMPMRSVPHRLVCLLGLDDGAFPRQSGHDGDNLLLASPQPGDRDPRSEDRQLLLDALMAAEDALIITYTGNDERTNALRPPAVPVGELLDAIDATVRCSDDDGSSLARERVRIVHPLQPFDPDNFIAGRLDVNEPWSFDRVSLAGARAFAGDRRGWPPFLDGELPPMPLSAATPLALRDLIAFVEHPVRAFLRQRLGVSLATDDDELEDALPVELDGLEAWGVGQRLLDGVLSGGELRELALAEIARGTLPPGELGRPALRAAWREVETLQRLAASHGGSGEPRSIETNVTLADGLRLTGTVPGVREHVALTVSYSRLAPRHRLAAWVRLLALTAAHPEVPFEAVTIGRARDADAAVVLARVPMLGPTPDLRSGVALGELNRLVSLYRTGMRRPLALPSQAAAAWVTAVRAGGDPAAAALAAWRSEWRGGRFHRGDDSDQEHRDVIGDELPLDDLERFAAELWQPLASRETVEAL